jgi:hypothetical protein
VKLTIPPAAAETFEELEAWRYEAPYDFYDGDQDPVLNPERFYRAHGEDGTLVGFYYFEEKGDAVEIGLGLRPDLTGRHVRHSDDWGDVEFVEMEEVGGRR